MTGRSLSIGVVCYPSYGGSGVIATELAKNLAGRGHQVHLISYDQPFRMEFRENLFYHEVDVPSYPLFKYPPYLLALANKMVEVTRHGGLDLLHVHYAVPHATAACLARQIMGNDLKIVTTLHGTDITLVGSDPSFADVVTYSINASDGVTAVSQHLNRTTRETFAVARDIRTIYNFIDPGEYRRLECSGLRGRFAGPDERLVIHVSNFRPVKRVPLVLEVFKEIQDRVPARLLLLGEGPEVPLVRRITADLGLCGRVSFMGRQDRVVELLSIADLLLLPSSHESFGLVALEAMACQVPVVGSRIGGLPEVVVDGETGFLLPPEDVRGMADRGVELLTSPALHGRLAAAGRRRAVERFHADQIIGTYEDYYFETLGSG